MLLRAVRTSIPFRTVLRDPHGGPAQPVSQLVQGTQELEALGLRARLKPSAFTDGPIAVVALGERASPAGSVEVVEVVAGDAPGEVIVRYQVRTDGAPGQAPASPIHAVTVPRGTRRCSFERAAE